MEERYRETGCFGEALTTDGRGKGSCFRTPQEMLVTLGSSEPNVSAQLYDACVGPEIDGRGDLAGGGISQYSAAVANVEVGIAPVDVIEHIKHVGPDLKCDRLVQWELFCDTEVDVREARPDKRIAVSIAKGSIRRVGKGRGVEPHGMGTMRNAWVANLLWVQGGTGVEGRGESGIDTARNRTLDHRGERNSAVPLEETGDAPATCDLIERPVQVELTPVSERHFVGDLTDQSIRSVEVRQTIIKRGGVGVLVDIDARSVTVSGAGIERFRPGVVDLEAQAIRHSLQQAQLQRVVIGISVIVLRGYAVKDGVGISAVIETGALKTPYPSGTRDRSLIDIGGKVQVSAPSVDVACVQHQAMPEVTLNPQ